MKVSDLTPPVSNNVPFRRDQLSLVPAKPGCYVLTTVDGTILYVGLATTLRSRMGQHLDTPEKVAATALGRARLFYWHECITLEVIERTWLNSHLIAQGMLPVLNRAMSPVSV